MAQHRQTARTPPTRPPPSDLLAQFDRLLPAHDHIAVRDGYADATEQERRTLLDELVAQVTVHPDRLVVQIHGAPPLNVTFSEAGLKDSGSGGVGGGT